MALLGLVIAGCSPKKAQKLPDTEILHQNQDKLTQVIIYDVFTPPVASRLYVYTSLASYEAIRFKKEGAPSVTARLKGFATMPEPEKGKDYNFTLAATKAFFNVIRNVRLFSVYSLTNIVSFEIPSIADTDAVMLSILTFRRVKMMVMRFSKPMWFSLYADIIYSCFIFQDH